MKRLVYSGSALALLFVLFFSAVALSACSDGTPQTKVQGSGNLATQDRITPFRRTHRRPQVLRSL